MLGPHFHVGPGLGARFRRPERRRISVRSLYLEALAPFRIEGLLVELFEQRCGAAQEFPASG